jgi:hypothetical protein
MVFLTTSRSCKSELLDRKCVLNGFAGGSSEESDFSSEDFRSENHDRTYSDKSIDIGIMLVGSWAFVMSMFYLINHHDSDMKR